MMSHCSLSVDLSRETSNSYISCPEEVWTSTGAANELKLCPGDVFLPDATRRVGTTLGSDGDDVIRIGTRGSPNANGMGGNDTIQGTWTQNEIRGGKGEDVMNGKGGNDTYVWMVEDFGGRDKVLNFWRGDKIMVAGLLSEDATLEQKMARLSAEKTGDDSFRVDILSEDGGTTLQGIDFEQTGALPACAASSDEILRMMLTQGAIQFADHPY
jgi:Ca2+-binding RTX toxin-like protein